MHGTEEVAVGHGLPAQIGGEVCRKVPESSEFRTEIDGGLVEEDAEDGLCAACILDL